MPLNRGGWTTVVHVTAIAWMLSLMLAPHSLARVGNLAGMHQGMFFLWIGPAWVLYWLTARSTMVVLKNNTMGPVVVMLSLAGRWTTTLMLSPLLLVTAGFAFNEIFVYWFPNFAFAFILLGGVLAIQLAGNKAVHIAQLILLVLVLAGLGTLIAMGLRSDTSWSAIVGSNQLTDTSLSPWAIMMLFVGFDLAFNQAWAGPKPREQPTITTGLLTAVVVIALWALASLLNVPGAKLSDSFIPHLVAARYIGGDPGRMIMGGVVIAGSGAAVNALFGSVARSNALMAAQWPSGPIKGLHILRRPAFWLVISAGVVAALMAGGMAGTEEIDIYVRAGLIIWLLYYGAVHLALLSNRLDGKGQLSKRPLGWLGPLVGAAAMLVSVGMLVATDPDRTKLLTFGWIVLAIAGLGWMVGRILVQDKNGLVRRDDESTKQLKTGR
jgi:hypothetical protein